MIRRRHPDVGQPIAVPDTQIQRRRVPVSSISELPTVAHTGTHGMQPDAEISDRKVEQPAIGQILHKAGRILEV